MKKQVTKIERTEFDWKAAAETKNERRKDRPKIELDQIQPERRDEIEFLLFSPTAAAYETAAKIKLTSVQPPKTIAALRQFVLR